MSELLISPKDKKELAFIQALLEKMNVKTTLISDEDKEDSALFLLIEQAKNSPKVSDEEVMKALKS